MAKNDIYNSKRQYQLFVENIPDLTKKTQRKKYVCKNPENLKYYRELANHFEMTGISYIRRMRLFRSFKVVTHFLSEDLSSITDRKSINYLVREMRKLNWAPKTEAEWIMDLKFMWKTLFPDKDAQGRLDETITPYAVRHLKTSVDKSREKRRDDRLTIEEIERLVQSFSQDQRMQAFISLAIESLARPQELLFLRLKDVNLKDNHAEIWVSEHGKEGTKLLRCIDSYYYVSRWLNSHPLREDPTAYLFINLGQTNKHKQMSVVNVNKHLREHCEQLKIRSITSYSLKRTGVTISILRGDAETDIQKRAGWTSTKQLKVYDLSDQREAYRRELIQRGLVNPSEEDRDLSINKICAICRTNNGIGEQYCKTCLRPLDRGELLKKEEAMEEKVGRLTKQLSIIQKTINRSFQENAMSKHIYLADKDPAAFQEAVDKDIELQKINLSGTELEVIIEEDPKEGERIWKEMLKEKERRLG